MDNPCKECPDYPARKDGLCYTCYYKKPKKCQTKNRTTKKMSGTAAKKK